MGFFSGDKSVEDMVEEEERLEQRGRLEQRRNTIEELKLLRELKKREGKDAKRMYKDSRSGKYDWEQMKFHCGAPGARSIVAVPRTNGEASKLGGA